jgi:hypothetical protein
MFIAIALSLITFSAHACSENSWEECVKEKRLRFFRKMGVVVLLLRSLIPWRGIRFTLKRI